MTMPVELEHSEIAIAIDSPSDSGNSPELLAALRQICDNAPPAATDQVGEILLSIVIPAYNEERRLPQTVLDTLEWGFSQPYNFELIIADDGSKDETLALAKFFERRCENVRALPCPHMGKGATVRAGVLQARGEYVLFMDADGATPLREIPKLLGSVQTGMDVAIGSRAAYSETTEVETPWYRLVIGRVFAFCVGLFATSQFADTQCGFKIFRRDASKGIFSRQKISGFAFDVEILYIAQKLGMTITEVPVDWVAQPGSKTNLILDPLRMLRDIITIRWMHRRMASKK